MRFKEFKVVHTETQVLHAHPPSKYKTNKEAAHMVNVIEFTHCTSVRCLDATIFVILVTPISKNIKRGH